MRTKDPRIIFLSMYTSIARLKGLADLYREAGSVEGRLTAADSTGVSVLLKQIADEIKMLANQLDA